MCKGTLHESHKHILQHMNMASAIGAYISEHHITSSQLTRQHISHKSSDPITKTDSFGPSPPASHATRAPLLVVTMTRTPLLVMGMSITIKHSNHDPNPPASHGY